MVFSPDTPSPAHDATGQTGDAAHVPVMAAEVVDFLAPRPGGIYCDATLGLGGHALEILRRSAPDGRLYGIDRDASALDATRARLMQYSDRITFIHARFSQIAAVLAEHGAPPLDGCVVDLGVSSPQLDVPERGFSFQRPGPLDMRMDQSTGATAADLLRNITEAGLATLLFELGEERHSRGIARAICAVRDRDGVEAIATTTALAALVARAVPSYERRKNPATRTFQALRLAVNGELAELEGFLDAAPGCLRPGGRLVAIAFHSLEDRLVKQRFRALAARDRGDDDGGGPRLRLLNKKVIFPSEAELAGNPRARSARLRAVERVAA